MKSKYLTVLLGLLLMAALLIGCSSAATETAQEPAADTAASAETPYIAVISKGFQHQFWQAVKPAPKSCRRLQRHHHLRRPGNGSHG